MNRRLRVLLVSRSTSRHSIAGGMERVLDQVARAIAEIPGAEVRLLTTVGGVGVDGPCPGWEVPHTRPGRYSLRWWLGSKGLGPWWDWAPDIVFAQGDAATTMAFSKARRCPLIIHAHGTVTTDLVSSLRTRTWRELAKVPLHLSRMPGRSMAARRADALVAVSDRVADSLRRVPYGVSAERIHTVPNGIDTSRYRFSAEERSRTRDRLGLAESARVGLFVGRLHRQKGADLAIAALARIPDPAYHLLVVGHGPEEKRLKALARRERVAPRVSFLGSVPQDEVSRLLSAGDVFVFPTRRTEGLPLSAMEALAAGMPVVTTRSAGVPSTAGEVHVIAARPTELAVAWVKAGSGRRVGGELPVSYDLASAEEAYRRVVREVLET